MTNPPDELRDRGSSYWAHITDTYELSASEMVVLAEVCRTLDNLDQLAAELDRTGAMVTGSTGQPVVNPALTEARGQRLALHRLIAALALPDVDGKSVPTARSIRGKTAAAARWPKGA